MLSRTAFAYYHRRVVCVRSCVQEAKRHKRAAQVVEIEGCTSVEPLRVRTRLGREHVMVCVEAHLQGLGVTCLFERERQKRQECKRRAKGVTFRAKNRQQTVKNPRGNPSEKYGNPSRLSKAEKKRPKDTNQFIQIGIGTACSSGERYRRCPR